MVEVSASLVLALIAAGFSQRAALDLAGIARSTWHYRDHPRARVSEPVAHRQRRTQCWLSKDERGVSDGLCKRSVLKEDQDDRCDH